MQKLFVTVVFALLVAACGGDAEPASAPTTSPQPEATASAPSSTADDTSAATSEAPSDSAAPNQPAATSEPSETSEPSFDGPPAPDFELVLSDGSTFRLSGEEKPVYMIFWAEW
jgi:hypothetical protein